MKRLKAGMTLIELTIATAIIAVVILILMGFLVGKLVAISQDNAKTDLSISAQLSLDIINRDIKQSADVEDQNVWPDSHGPGAPANLYGWQSGTNVLVIGRPAEDQNDNILYEDPKTYVSYKNDFIYFVDAATKKLYKRVLAAQVSGNQAKTSCPAGTPNCPADIKLADNVSSFSIQYYDANDNIVDPVNARSVAVTLVLTKTAFGKSFTINQSIQTVFRNK